MGIKNQKGTVSIENYRERIRLRWRFQGVRYALNLSAYTKVNLIQAKKIASVIEQDMALGNFDNSLAKYKSTKINSPLKSHVSMVDLFERWVINYKNLDFNKNSDYFYFRNTIRKWGVFNSETILLKLNSEKFSPKTYNNRLGILKGFSNWLVEIKIWETNPLKSVCSKKINKLDKKDRQPFTVEEIQMILKAFREDSFCPKSSRFSHSHYYSFLYFIFKTGVRNSEAVGLQVQNIDIVKGLIMINQVLARTVKGTHSSARVRKETKNGKVRYIPLTEDLKSLLEPLVKGKNGEDLVFQSHYGLSIDDRMFQRRVFKPVLKALGIEDRVLYACRHTFATRCVENGINPVITAYLMGNNPETALRNYVHLQNIPKQLPDL
jgi:integrase